jgi:3-dehydroquinate dehydratase-2
MSEALRFLVLHGPNLNLLGVREPEIYGRATLEDIESELAAVAKAAGAEVQCFHSNHEGALIDRIHEHDFDGALVNAAGLTHTSVALRDALLAVHRPFVEVHLTDPSTREPFRSVNFLADIAIASVVGKGAAGYDEALEILLRHLRDARGGRELRNGLDAERTP